MSAIETLGQLGEEIKFGRNEHGWHCNVDGLCWVDGRAEMGHPAFGRSPEQAAARLIELIRKPPRGVPSLRKRKTGGEMDYLPILLIVMEVQP